MGNPNEQDNTIMSGLRIEAARPEDSGVFSEVQPHGGGTITAVARDQNGNPVVVTNAHIITGRDHNNPRGGETVHHHEFNSNDSKKIGSVPDDSDVTAWVERLIAPRRNKLDAAYAVLDYGVKAHMVLHGHGPTDSDGNETHTARRIVPGTHDPVAGDTLLFLGRNSGEHEVTVEAIDTPGADEDPEISGGFDFHQMIQIRTTIDLEGGDSGAGLFKEISPNEYQLSCIFFSSYKSGPYQIDLNRGYACKASEVATALNITFGNSKPTAVPGNEQTVRPRATVRLHGGASMDPEAQELEYKWEQVVLPGLPTVNVRDSDQEEAVFEAPSFACGLLFKLTVTDPYGGFDANTVKVTVQNREPIAHAGPNRVINANNPVTLEGSVSDPDLDDRCYVLRHHTWTQDSGPETITLNPVADEPVHRTFTPDVVGEYFFTLTATDQEPLSASDTVRVSVWPSAQSVLPTRVRATAAARSVALGWTGPSIATGYEVEIGIPPSEGGQNHTFHTSAVASINIGSLTPQQTYEYRVRMTNSDGVGPWTDWATVVTPGETPPKPTGDQWDVQYLNNKIQVKLTELPAVIPAISQVKAFLGTGLEPDLTTVEKEVGTTLNQSVDVLESSETDWRTGRWLAQIRFVNSTGSSRYSTGKPVTVPNHPPVAKPGINRVVPVYTPPSLTPAVTLVGAAEDPDAGHVEDMRYSWRVDSAPSSTTGSSTRSTTHSASRSPSSRVILTTPMENGVEVPNKRTFTPTAIGDYVFTLTVRDPGDLTHSASVTIHAGPANETSDWFDTGETRCHNNALQKRQTQPLRAYPKNKIIDNP